MKKEVVTSERILGKTSEKNNTGRKQERIRETYRSHHHRAGNNMAVCVPVYITGLFIMTLGIGISVKSDLGVSPVSSIPYTMTCVWGIEMGKATILFHAALVAIQIILLRRRFRLRNLLQVPGRDHVRIFHHIFQLSHVVPAGSPQYSDPAGDVTDKYIAGGSGAVLLCTG